MTVTMMNQRFLLLFAVASSVGATTLQQALIEDIMPPSSEHCRDIFVNGHPRPIIVNGEDMFTEVSHIGASSNEENQTWAIRLDPAGNLYRYERLKRVSMKRLPPLSTAFLFPSLTSPLPLPFTLELY